MSNDFRVGPLVGSLSQGGLDWSREQESKTRAMRVAVTGAGGAIGAFLVGRMLEEKHEVYASDIKPMSAWHEVHQGAINLAGKDLMQYDNARRVIPFHCDEIYNLAHDDSTPMARLFSIDIVSSMLKAAMDLDAKSFLQVSAFGHQTFGAELCRVVNQHSAINVRTFTYVISSQCETANLVKEIVDSMRGTSSGS